MPCRLADIAGSADNADGVIRPTRRSRHGVQRACPPGIGRFAR
ncbi:hypothetical protein HMPREF3150_04924 [Pseudomonas aeruginosa]|nr:hypothetical protein HMPREF3150_04924 [Pseudomonas aeruginosa]